MERYPDVVDICLARKRGTNAANWKRNKAKQKLYAAKDLPDKPTCKHKNKKLQCTDITMSDLLRFHEMFFSIKEKVKQDTFLLKHVKAVEIKRKRPRATSSKKYNDRKFQLKYNIYCKSQRKMKQVCQKAFLGILHIKRNRIESSVKNFYINGKYPKENRGGDHKSHKFTDKKQSVITFIKTFKCSEPHYCRGNTKRLYLPSELSINKMAKMYNQQAVQHLKVKPLYFRSIFNTCFNLGFGSPRVDVCSTCLQLTEKLKTAKTDREKQDLMISKTVHKRRAKAFFDMLRDGNPSLKIMSFDCQKNMPLPKIPDQITYYSRQLYLHNFTVVEGTSKSSLTKENVFSYCWTENEFAKDSNLIASAVHHRLINTNFPSECNSLRLMADGCSGQNKNTTMMAMLAKWLIQDAPAQIKQIEVVFPVVGHSFLPPDRVFARIEKDLRNIESITDPKMYTDVMSRHSTIVNIASECTVLDWKTATKNTLLDVSKWHVQFSKCKRFYLKRTTRCKQMVGLRGELHYRIDTGEYKNICKKNKTTAMLAPTVVAPGVIVKQLKLRDVNKLLCTHCGTEWRNLETLEYFTRVVPTSQEISISTENVDDSNEELLCEEQQELPSLLI